MSALRKPWEGAVVNTKSSVVPFDSPSRLLLGTGPPRLNALRDRDVGKMASSTSESRKTSTIATKTSNTEIKWGINIWRVKIR